MLSIKLIIYYNYISNYVLKKDFKETGLWRTWKWQLISYLEYCQTA